MPDRSVAPSGPPLPDSLTAGLAALLAAKPITREDRARAALFVLDTVANAIAGSATEPGRRVLAWAAQTGSGRGWPAEARTAAFVMGALSHILEMDDLHRGSVVHPGCVVVPAAWAIARREGRRGHAFLDAVLWGYEAAARIGMAVGAEHYRHWHNTATCGPFGATAAAGRLLGLAPRALCDAFGNAGTQSSGLWEFLATGAMSKHLHAGRAADAGVLAADLAALGFTGPPRILEGDHGLFRATCPDARPGMILQAPEGRWQLHETSIKPWPSCRHTHPAIDAARSLKNAVDSGRIATVQVATYGAAVEVCDRPEPETDYEAKFSLQHAVAAALLRDEIDFSAFGPKARAEAQALRGRIALEVDPNYDHRYPDYWGSAVTVTLDDGQVLDAARRDALGDPAVQLSPSDLARKADMLLAFGGAPEPSDLRAAIEALAADGPLPDLAASLFHP